MRGLPLPRHLMQKGTIALLALFLISCSSSTPQEIEETPLGEEGETVTPEVETSSSSSSSSTVQESSSSPAAPSVSLSSFSPHLSEWQAAWGSRIPGFNLSTLKRVQTKTLKAESIDALVEHESILAKQDELDYPILFFSEDEKTIVYISPSGEPDSEVAIIKPDLNLYERHLFCGTACAFDSAVWMDNERFAVTGYSEFHPSSGEERCTETTPCTFVPTLHVFDITAQTISKYEGPEVDAAVFMEAKLGE